MFRALSTVSLAFAKDAITVNHRENSSTSAGNPLFNTYLFALEPESMSTADLGVQEKSIWTVVQPI